MIPLQIERVIGKLKEIPQKAYIILTCDLILPAIPIKHILRGFLILRPQHLPSFQIILNQH